MNRLFDFSGLPWIWLGAGILALVLLLLMLRFAMRPKRPKTRGLGLPTNPAIAGTELDPRTIAGAEEGSETSVMTIGGLPVVTPVEAGSVRSAQAEKEPSRSAAGVTAEPAAGISAGPARAMEPDTSRADREGAPGEPQRGDPAAREAAEPPLVSPVGAASPELATAAPPAGVTPVPMEPRPHREISTVMAARARAAGALSAPAESAGRREAPEAQQNGGCPKCGGRFLEGEMEGPLLMIDGRAREDFQPLLTARECSTCGYLEFYTRQAGV